MYQGEELIITIGIFFAVLLVIFMIIRELVLWYLKINEKVNLLKSIDHKLSYLMPDNYVPPKSSNQVVFKPLPESKQYEKKSIKTVNEDASNNQNDQYKDFKEKYKNF